MSDLYQLALAKPRTRKEVLAQRRDAVEQKRIAKALLGEHEPAGD